MRLKRRDLGETRARILAAAEDVSCELGPARLSLEGVASRAGVSKGGLLYHFPSKHALLRALVEEHVAELRQAMEELAPGALAGGPPLRAARAWLRAVQAKLARGEGPPSGVFAAIAEDPEFIAPLREFRAEMREVFRRCPDPDLAETVWLACEGLVHETLTDPPAVAGRRLDRLFARLDALLG